jgi:hypothetical protein
MSPIKDGRVLYSIPNIMIMLIKGSAAVILGIAVSPFEYVILDISDSSMIFVDSNVMTDNAMK